MRSTGIKRAATLFAVAALAAVPAASASPPEDHPGKPENPGSQGKGHGKGKAKTKGVTYVFKGTYQGSGAVAVDHGNAHVVNANLVGVTVTFDLTAAKVVVADSNADGKRDLTDVASGDRVMVKSRMPRTDPAAQPFAARQLVDQTHAGDASAD
jgi:hypothetical protein